MTDIALQPDTALVLRLGHKFRLRRTEWLAALQCFLWGLVLMMPGATFDGVAFSVIRTWAPEEVFGVVMLFAGAVRLAGLAVNGARRRVTPWVRLAGALVGCGLFTAISLGFAASGVLGIWAAAWPVLVAIEYLNIYDATRDARQAHG